MRNAKGQFVKGYPSELTPETRIKIANSNRGKKRSQESRKRMSLAHKGIPGYWTGKKRSPEDIEKFRKSHLGKKWSEETRKKQSLLRKGKRMGADSPSWKGGKSRDKHNGRVYIEWTRKVFERDGFTCLICKKTGGDLNAHHIKSWANYPDLRMEIDNGVTLCVKCHQELHKKQKIIRKRWL